MLVIMNSKKIIFILLFCLTAYFSALAQYSGSNGKGDNLAETISDLNGILFLYNYAGGNGKGDNFIFYDGSLNGDLFQPLYSGSIGRGDIVGEVVNTILSSTNTLFIGGQAKGDNFAVLMNSPLGDYFTGTISTNFSLPDNWSNFQFPNGFTAHVTSSTSQPVLDNLLLISTNTTINIHSGASLDVNTSGILQVDGVINNSGTITLYSDATGSGTIGTSNGSITGAVTVQRYIPAVARRYRLYSPPITNYNYSQLIDDIFVTGPANGIGFDATLHANNPSVYTYQEATTGGRGWKTFSTINTDLAIGNGALIFIRGDRTLPAPQWYTAPYVAQNAVTLDCTGELQFGPLTINLTYNTTGDANVDGFNLVGNPYASPIDWSLVTKNNISPFYYVLNPITNAFEAYNSGNIASGQAFFVRATNTNPNITFNESNKSTTNTNGYFKTAIVPMEFVFEMDSITKDKLYLNFDDNHSMNFNLNEDAIKLSNPSSLSIYSELNNSKIQINAVPNLDNWLVTDTVFISTSASSGTYKINIQRLPTSMLGRQLWLQDKLTNVSFALLNDTSFQIQITSANITSYNRFALFMKNSNPVPVQWIKYSGLVKGNNAELNWSTGNEKNNHGFFIERKLKGDSTFNSIGFIKGSGNSTSIKRYSFIDSGIFNSNTHCFYRLRQMNYDGTYSYSRTIKLEGLNTSDHEIMVYPNPTKRNGILFIESIREDDEFRVVIINSVGEEILIAESTKNKLELNINTLSPGVYFIQYLSLNYHNKTTKKWVVY